MQLLLVGHGIIGFVDGSNLCPAHFITQSGDLSIENSSSNSSSQVENDAYIVRKLHNHALMWLITTTLSPVIISCAIGSTNAHDL